MPLSRLTFRGMTAVTMAVNAPLDAVLYTLDLPPSLSAEDISARDYQNQTSGFHQAAGVGRMSDACWRRTRADAASSSCSATPRRWISDRRTDSIGLFFDALGGSSPCVRSSCTPRLKPTIRAILTDRFGRFSEMAEGVRNAGGVEVSYHLASADYCRGIE